MYAPCLCLHVVVRTCVSKSAYPSYTKWMACSKSLRNNNNVPFTTGGSPRWVARRIFAPLLLLPWAHPTIGLTTSEILRDQSSTTHTNVDCNFGRRWADAEHASIYLGL